MNLQLRSDVMLWDNNKLSNVWCLIPKDFKELNTLDYSNYWIEFRKKYGNYGYHSLSKPIFNKDKTKCIIEHSGQGGLLQGSNEIFLYIKVEGKWKLLKEIVLQIS